MIQLTKRFETWRDDSLYRVSKKMFFLLNLSHNVKSYGHLCQFLAFFTMLALQIWPCHVTQEAISKKFYFFLILYLILGKVTKFVVEKLSTSEVISQKPHGGWKHSPPPPPPVLLGLNRIWQICSRSVLLSSIK